MEWLPLNMILSLLLLFWLAHMKVMWSIWQKGPPRTTSWASSNKKRGECVRYHCVQSSDFCWHNTPHMSGMCFLYKLKSQVALQDMIFPVWKKIPVNDVKKPYKMKYSKGCYNSIQLQLWLMLQWGCHVTYLKLAACSFCDCTTSIYSFIHKFRGVHMQKIKLLKMITFYCAGNMGSQTQLLALVTTL